ncbi:MAG: glycosyltransferase [Phycisphaerales bacterium]
MLAAVDVLAPLVTWVLVALAGIAAVYWAVVIVRLVELLATLPRVSDGLEESEPEGGWPLVSIIVPAHNEERVIEACATSMLLSDYPALEILFVLDRCSDGTLDILRPIAARDERLRIIENHACPPDWAGKCHAAKVGAESARGDYLLFTDADVRFGPDLVRSSMGLLLRDRRGLLSLLPTLVTDAWYERIVQPVATMTLLRMYPINKVNRDERRRPFANGQFLLFDRSVYERVGGHAATKNDLLEDIAFARLVDSRGARVGLAVADDSLVVHMYPSFKAMQTGWRRIFIEACKRRVSRLRQNAFRVACLGVLTPLVQIGALAAAAGVGGAALLAAVAVVAGGLLTQAVALIMIYRSTRSPVSGAIFFPVGCAAVAHALWRGASDLAARRPVRWGGREYVLVPQD